MKVMETHVGYSRDGFHYSRALSGEGPSPSAMWQRGEVSPGADLEGVSPVLVQMRQGVGPVPAQM